MTRLRVALLAHSVDDRGAKGSGMERACAELIRHGRGEIDFVVVSSDLPEDLRGEVEWLRIRLPRRPSLLRLLVFFVFAGWRLQRLNVDVIHATGAIVPNTISLASVHYCHAGFRDRTGARAPRDGAMLRRLNTSAYRVLAELVERWVYRPARCGFLVPVSRGLSDEVRQLYPGVPVVVIRNGVDSDRFRPDPRVRADIRREEQVGDRDVVVLFVGGDWNRKGLELALRAVGAARAGGLPVRLWVVGAGDEARMADVAADCGAATAVRFFGRRIETERFYAGADLFVLPSAYEAFPLVVLEAAASGLPVLGAPVSGLVELADHGGAVLAERSVEGLEEALRWLVRDPTRRRIMGAAARVWAEQLTWEANAEATIALYRRISSDATLIGPMPFASRI